MRSCEKRLDIFSAQNSAIEIKMAATGFYDQSNASDIAVQGAEVESIDFQLKWLKRFACNIKKSLSK